MSLIVKFENNYRDRLLIGPDARSQIRGAGLGSIFNSDLARAGFIDNACSLLRL